MFKYTLIFSDPNDASGSLELPVEGPMEIGRIEGDEIIVRCGGVSRGTGILDRNVSRIGQSLHLRLEGGNLLVQDMGSLCGTCLDGKLLPGWEKKTRHPSRPIPIESNSRLEIGATAIQVWAKEILMAPAPWIEKLGPEHIKNLENLTARHLIFLADTEEKARLIAETFQIEQICKYSLPMDKILALKLTDSPELAGTVERILTLILNSGKGEEYEERLEELIEAKKSGRETYEDREKQMWDLFKEALETIRAASTSRSCAPAPSVRYCPACGIALQPDYRFCPACRKEL